jgi:hypothetical protein
MNLGWVWVSGWVAVSGSMAAVTVWRVGSRVLTVDLPSRLTLGAGCPTARVYETKPWPGTVLQSAHRRQTDCRELCAMPWCAGCRASHWAPLSRTQVLVSSSARRASATGMVVVESVWVTSGTEALATRSTAMRPKNRIIIIVIHEIIHTHTYKLCRRQHSTASSKPQLTAQARSAAPGHRRCPPAHDCMIRHQDELRRESEACMHVCAAAHVCDVRSDVYVRMLCVRTVHGVATRDASPPRPRLPWPHPECTPPNPTVARH